MTAIRKWDGQPISEPGTVTASRLVDADGRVICTFPPVPDHDEDAKALARAVNGFDDLLAASKAMIEALATCSPDRVIEASSGLMDAVATAEG